MRVDTGDGPDLAAAGRALRRRKMWLVVPVMVAVAVSVGQSYTAHELYESFAEIRLPDQPISLFGDTPTLTEEARENIAQSQADLISTAEVASKVEELLGPGADAIESVTHRLTSDAILRVFVTSPEPRLSQAAADAYANAYIEHLAQRTKAAADEQINRLNAFLGDVQKRAVDLESQLQAIDAQIARIEDPIASKTANAQQRGEYATLTSSRELLLSQQAALRGNLSEISLRIDQLRADAELQDNNRGTVQRKASLPESPSYPTPLRSALLAAAIGGLLGLAAMYAREATDKTVHTARDFATAYPSLDILGTVEQGRVRRGKPSTRAPRIDLYGPPSEDFRSVRARLTNVCTSGQVLVAEVHSSRSRPSIVADLALSLAAAGRSVAAVDANLRSPSLHERFGVDNSFGVSALLDDPALPVAAAVRSFNRNQTTMALAVAGRPTGSPADALDNPAFEKLITGLSGYVEYVLIDAPPLGAVSDALIAARTVEFTLLVVRLGVTTTKEIDQALHDLARANTAVVGIVLVDTVSRSRPVAASTPPPFATPSGVAFSRGTVGSYRATTAGDTEVENDPNAWVSRLVTRRSPAPGADVSSADSSAPRMTMQDPTDSLFNGSRYSAEALADESETPPDGARANEHLEPWQWQERLRKSGQ